MRFDYSRLRGKIVEVYRTTEEFAKQMGMAKNTLSLKLNNKADWSRNEIVKAAKLLGLTSADVPMFFFSEEVQKTELL